MLRFHTDQHDETGLFFVHPTISKRFVLKKKYELFCPLRDADLDIHE